MTDTADFLRVLADETRLSMLWLLSNHDEICVCDLMAALDITQSKASRHLATLRHARLVTDRREGTWSYYAIRRPEGKVESALLNDILDGFTRDPAAAAVGRKLRVCMEKRCRGAGNVARSYRRSSAKRALAQGAQDRTGRRAATSG